MLRQSSQNDLAELHSKPLSLALETLSTGNEETALEVERIEVMIDDLALEVDALAVELIIKQQPVADDLRRIIGSMHIAQIWSV